MIGWNGFCATDLRAQLVINEVCSANNAVLQAPEGDHPDWVELHNAGASPVQLHDYRSLGQALRTRTVALANDGAGAPDAYIVLFAGSEAVRFPFGIDRQGERIVLSDLALQPVQVMDVPELGMDHSFGGDANGAGAHFFAVPTPGAANTSALYPGTCRSPLSIARQGIMGAARGLVICPFR